MDFTIWNVEIWYQNKWRIFMSNFAHIKNHENITSKTIVLKPIDSMAMAI